MPHFPKPFYRKPRRRWYVQFNGKQINLGPDRDEAFRIYHEMMAEPTRFTETSHIEFPAAADSIYLATICDRFLEWVLKNRAKATYDGYLYRLQRLLDRYPQMTVDELKPYHVQEWADSYDFTSTSKRNYVRAIKACMRWAHRQGYIEKNPIDQMAVPAANRKDVYASPEEFQRILRHTPDAGLRELFEVTYEVGCRPQESLRLEARHVELETQRWIFPMSEAKGKKAPRIVYLTEKAMETTRRLMLKYPEGNLFRTSQGTVLKPDNVNSAVDRIRLSMGKEIMRTQDEKLTEPDIAAEMKRLANAGAVHKNKQRLRSAARRHLFKRRAKELVPRYSLYALRHSWATNALKRGLDSLTVAILMGHQDPSMLAKVYQHLSHNPEHLLKQAKRAAG